ncbi:MAG: YdeI family protein [Sphingomonadaceae bacterium]
MATTDPRVDAYIAAAADFAQPVLNHVRAVVHAACPDVEETMKWSFPHFMYHGMLCSMAAFKSHCALNFWKAALLIDAADDKGKQAMGQFGRITTIADLPPVPALSAYLQQAMQLNDAGIKTPARAKVAAKSAAAAVSPDFFSAALAANPTAQQHFASFSTSKQREYIDWLTEAKTEATRQRRLEQAIGWIAEGKTRNWKYEKC